MSLTKEECEKSYANLSVIRELLNINGLLTNTYDKSMVTFARLINEHFEIIKEKEAVEKELDKACELIKEAVSQDCTIFDKVTLDNLCWIIKRGELKEWCMKTD